MKEHPILMSSEMVRAIMNGHKSQTRRPVTAHNSVVGVGRVDWTLFDWAGESIYVEAADWPGSPGPNHRAPKPFVDGQPQTGEYLHVPYNWAENGTIYRIYPRYQVGDHLWVKETWRAPADVDHLAPLAIPHPFRLAWYDMCPPEAGKRRPSMFMPRWACRLTLRISAIRVQRLQNISEADAIAEGCPPEPWYRVPGGPLKWFSTLWDRINGQKHPWSSNPWVRAIEFVMRW